MLNLYFLSNYLGGEIGSAFVSDGDEFFLSGVRRSHVSLDLTADSSVKGSTKTSVRSDSNKELFLRSLGSLKKISTSALLIV